MNGIFDGNIFDPAIFDAGEEFAVLIVKPFDLALNREMEAALER